MISFKFILIVFFAVLCKATFYQNITFTINITLYNFFAKEVIPLASNFKNSRYYLSIFNIENLASFIYYYRLFSDNNIQTGSMIILK